MHAGSRDLLLYQHRARCTLGVSCLPFISTGYRDVAGLWDAAYVYLLDMEVDHIFLRGVLQADYVFVCADVPA